MNKKIFFAITAFSVFISCKNKSGYPVPEELDEHGPEGVVTLNIQQREALGLKLGTFQMRNLTTVVKINGQLEVPPSGSADVTAIIGGHVKEIKVFHGDKVKKGEVLAVLDILITSPCRKISPKQPTGSIFSKRNMSARKSFLRTMLEPERISSR